MTAKCAYFAAGASPAQLRKRVLLQCVLLRLLAAGALLQGARACFEGWSWAESGEQGAAALFEGAEENHLEQGAGLEDWSACCRFCGQLCSLDSTCPNCEGKGSQGLERRCEEEQEHWSCAPTVALQRGNSSSSLEA